jgi:hypothetical protein
MGSAERPLSLSAQFQWCGDNRPFTYRCTFGFRLLTKLQWLSLRWILLVTFMKLLLHIFNIIDLLILSDTDICGLYEYEIWVRLATHQYMWHHCKINEYYIISIWKCLLHLEILSLYFCGYVYCHKAQHPGSFYITHPPTAEIINNSSFVNVRKNVK